MVHLSYLFHRKRTRVLSCRILFQQACASFQLAVKTDSKDDKMEKDSPVKTREEGDVRSYYTDVRSSHTDAGSSYKRLHT